MKELTVLNLQHNEGKCPDFDIIIEGKLDLPCRKIVSFMFKKNDMKKIKVSNMKAFQKTSKLSFRKRTDDNVIIIELGIRPNEPDITINLTEDVNNPTICYNYWCNTIIGWDDMDDFNQTFGE